MIEIRIEIGEREENTLKRFEHYVHSCGVFENEILSRAEPILDGTQPSKLISASFGKKRGKSKAASDW
jgi:hypothetical protein